MAARAMLLLVLTTGVGCAGSLPLVSVDSSAAMDMLAGEWRGGYIGTVSEGVLVFRLTARAGQASGEVLMTPTGMQPAPAAPGEKIAGDPRGFGQPLPIAIVRADDAHVTGSLAPYWDPTRRCHARATFTGQLRGDSLRGTFVSVCADGGTTTSGRWWAQRQATRESHDRDSIGRSPVRVASR